MDTFDIRLFGAIEVLRDGRPLTGFRSQKTLVLLAYLTCQNRPLTRAYLAGLFWPDATDSQALGHLRRALHNLTKNLSGCLDVNRRTAAFHPEAPAVVDVHQFQALAKQDTLEAIDAAVALARAPFLEGIYDSDSPELERWIEQEREGWLQKTIRLTERLIDAARRQGRYDLALSYAQKLAALAPWQEENHCRLMRLYAKTGQRQVALAQYETCRRLLAEELDVPPSPETDALYQRLRQAPPIRHNLPPSPTPFIGRQKELDALRSMLTNPDCRLITIVGAGGIGKTRLALELAGQSVNHYLEGVWFVQVADVLAPEGLLTALGTVFNLSFTLGGDPAGQLIDFLRDKELLLALDNFEHLADTPDFLAEILQRATAVQLLVTSRRPLNLREEWLFDLDGLPYPQPGETGDLLAYEAPRLFAKAARRRCSRFNLAANSAAVIQICQLVQGIPLALEMAAATCRDMPCADVAAAISENLDILQTPLRNIPERHRSVQATFDYSWNLLDADDQSAYARLSLFRGGFSLAAAQTVAAVAQQSIQRLAEQSLLKQTSPARYEIHDLLRQYAREKLDQNPALANQMHFRHAAYFTARLAEYGANLGRKARAAVTVDLGNIVAAWQWAAGHSQWPLLAQGSDSLAAYFLDVGTPQEGITHLDSAIAQVEAALAVPARRPFPPAALQGRLLAHKAHLLIRSGQSDAARRAAQQALALTAETPDAQTQVEAAYALAFADFEQGKYQTSRQRAKEGLELARQSGLKRLAVLCLNQAGRCCLETNDLDTAQVYFEQTAELARTLPLPQYEITANINLSLIQNSQGNYAAAEALLQQALKLADQLAYSALNGAIYLNLGTMCFQQGDYARGQAYYQAAHREYRQSGNQIKLALSCHAQASVALERGDFAASLRCFEQALALYQKTGARHRQLIILGELGDVLRLVGKYSAAHTRLRDALALSRGIGENISRLNLQVQSAWLAIETGDFATAQAELAQIDRLLQDSQPVEQECLACLTWCRFWYFRGNLAEARRYGAMALNLARKQNQRLLPVCAIRQGYVLVEMNEWESARSLFAEALQIRKKRVQPHLAAEARAGLARTALAQGDLTEALKQVAAVLRFLDGPEPPNTLAGTQEPALAYLACYEVLRAAGDGRAAAVLDEGLDFLQERAAGLDEEQRRLFLEAVPPNRRLVMAGPKTGDRPQRATLSQDNR